MEKKTDFFKEDRIGDPKKDSLRLKKARKEALNQTAKALECVISLQKLSEELHASNIGNIVDTKKSLVDSMVYLAIVSSEGDYARIKKTLAKYGLEDTV